MPYKQSNSKKGTVLVSMSTKEMNSKFEKALVLSIIITLILIAIAIVIINKVIAKITSPLTEPADISGEISKGDLTKEVKILKNDDEMGKLS
ncbi:HAMP domain-containing protein [Clostridium sp. JNZ X4-2]